jgi:hypothetical protein
MPRVASYSVTFTALLCGVATGLFACAGPSAGVPRTDPPAAPAEPPERAVPDILLHQARVLLDGYALDQATPGKLEKAEGLFNALLPRGMRWSGNGVRTYTLTTGAQTDGAQMKSIVQTAAAAGWPIAAMRADDSIVTLRSELYQLNNSVESMPPGAAAPLEWPDRALTIVVRNGSVELWRVSQAKPASQTAPPAPASAPSPPEAQIAAQSLATVTATNVRTDLPPLLEAECNRGSACSPAILYVANDASTAVIDQALTALALVVVRRGQSTLVELRFDEPAPDGPPPNAKPAATAVGGRLAPEVIQKAVRAQFGGFRLCYEQGLRRDPGLTGRIAVRFVIDRDGNVAAVGKDPWTTSMRDAEVTRCVVDHFKGIVFPPPEGGIVTVVYPIMFSPGS